MRVYGLAGEVGSSRSITRTRLRIQAGVFGGSRVSLHAKTLSSVQVQCRRDAPRALSLRTSLERYINAALDDYVGVIDDLYALDYDLHWFGRRTMFCVGRGTRFCVGRRRMFTMPCLAVVLWLLPCIIIVAWSRLSQSPVVEWSMLGIRNGVDIVTFVGNVCVVDIVLEVTASVPP